MTLPDDHSLRHPLNDEVHARPPDALPVPLRVSYLALLCDQSCRQQEWQHVSDLVSRFGASPPEPNVNHCSTDLGPFRLKWERHTEYSRYTFAVPGAGEGPFDDPAINAVPPDWVAALPGSLMVASHVALVPGEENPPDYESIARALFGGNELVGANVAGGAGAAFTDFRIHGDGFSRVLVQDRSMTPRQRGRTIQRLLEVDTYRMMALLALPVARELAPFLGRCEDELTRVTTDLVNAGESDEPGLLERLTRLEAEIESREADNHYRFSAAKAYYELVQSRISGLREERIQGLQLFREFTDRRLAPAINTCRATARRQTSLSERVARTTQLLSTRVDMTRERQSQELLASMDRRAKLQLRLQETVEGLSVAAITYYVVGLVGYGAKAFETAGAAMDPALVTGVSIPVVAAIAILGVRRIRRMVKRDMS